jgi:phenylalanyl-tRNA synthetase beta chain
MKISYNWLKQYIQPIPSPEECAKILTDTGLEVEGTETFESVKGGLKGLVIGEVLECEKHPNADRLSITKVNVGAAEHLQIVCGAPNVAKGQKVLVAMVGSTLHPSKEERFEIKQSKIRGELSQGMICAEDEVGLGTSHEGIMVLNQDAQVGVAAAEYFKINTDTVFEIGLTPNRVDAASHYGTARDLFAALYKNENVVLKMPELKSLKESNDLNFNIKVENTQACPRYSGICVSGIKVAASPDWLKNSLLAIGLKPINNIVDITNFVLHELGHPLHAFDLDKIDQNQIIVKTYPDNTSFVTLDGIERKLNSEDLMISSASEPLCIAGVFGGQKSGVNENTTSVFIESAYFNPVWVRKTSKRHGLKTDASFRFERGADPEITIVALQRAVDLILEIAGGKIASKLFDIYPNPVAKNEIKFRYSYADQLIGEKLDRNIIQQIFKRLGIQIVEEQNESLAVQVPHFKPDVLREADLVEEILRIYGYNNIKMPEKMRVSQVIAPKPDKLRSINHISDFLVSNGFTECMNNSLTTSSYLQTDERFQKESPVSILNPLSSELDIMRNQMMFGLLENMAYNLNRQGENLKLFEFGRTYHKSQQGYDEKEWLVMAVCGDVFDENWMNQNPKADFYFLKGITETILNKQLGSKFKIDPINAHVAGLDQAISLKHGNSEMAQIGLLQKKVLKHFDINQPVAYALIDFDYLFRSFAGIKPKYKEVPKFPKVRRDLALLIDQQVSFKELEQLAFDTERKILKKVNLFDIYQGDKMEAGKKSYAVSFEFLDETQTLSDQQIEKTMKRLIDAFGSKFGATLR